MHHSEAVASKHYDRDLPNLKANVVVFLAGHSNSNQVTAEDIPECVAKTRKLRDQQDREAAKQAGKEMLMDESRKSNPANKRTSQWSLRPDEREVFQKVLSDVENQESCAAIFQLVAGEHLIPSGSDTDGAQTREFPKGNLSHLFPLPPQTPIKGCGCTSCLAGARWQKLLYGLLDSSEAEGETGKDQLARRMKEIEQDMFHEKFKYKGNQVWLGTPQENLEADKRIAAANRASLKQYENNPQRAGFKGHFFKF